MKKAERIFWETYVECKDLRERHGFQRNPNGEAVGYNTLCTEETFCARTISAVQKELDTRLSWIRFDKRHGIPVDPAKEEVLEMVQATINNARRAIAI